MCDSRRTSFAMGILQAVSEPGVSAPRLVISAGTRLHLVDGMTSCVTSLNCAVAAVDENDLSAHIVGGRRRQIQDQIGDLDWLAEPPQRNSLFYRSTLGF